MEKYVFGVDIGINSVNVGLFSEDIELIEKWVIPWDKRHKSESVLPYLSQFIKDIAQGKEIKSVGLSVAGPVINNSIVLDYKEQGFGSAHIKAAFEKMTGIDTYVINDCNAAALGEMIEESRVKSFNNAFFISVGKSIGGAVISKGEIITGFSGSAGEIGHIIINPFETEKCRCGRCGCLEQYVSLSGIIKYANTLKLNRMETKLGNMFTIKDISLLAEKGDPLCSKVVEFTGFNIGLALSMASNIFDPEKIILSGGVIDAGENIVNSVINNYRKYAYKDSSKAEITTSKIKENAGIFGAAKFASSF